MGEILNIDEVVSRKENSLKSMDNLLSEYINSGDNLKKANLISYWIKDFSNYIKFEDEFDSKRLIRYSRGDVIKVNLGFRVGKELGGLHYAVVIENSNKRNSGVITIVPLSSTEGRKVHSTNVDLGQDLFSKANAKYNNLKEKNDERLYLLNLAFAAIKELKLLKDGQDINDPITIDDCYITLDDKDIKPISIQSLIDEFNDIKAANDRLLKYEKELKHMKSGSMAVINQITTISKQRIYTPKKSEDFLYGVKLSTSSMDKINTHLRDHLIFLSKNLD